MVETPRWMAEGERLASRAPRGGIAAIRPRDELSVLSRVVYALLLLCLALFQATFLPALDLIGVVPDIALVFLLIWSSARGAAEGMIWAFGLGLWLDLLTLERLGTHAIALLTVALIGGAVRGRFFRSGAILPILAVIIATLAYNLALIVIHVFQGDRVVVDGVMRLALLSSLLNALLVPIAYGVLMMLERWMPRRVS